MKSKGIVSVMFCVLFSVAAFAQNENQRPTPPNDWVTPEIPGVVAAGTKIELIKSGLRGSDGPVALPDGSVAMMGGGLVKFDKDGNMTVLVEKVQGAGLAVDSKGRIIAAQGTGKVVVLYPKGSETVLADNYDGKPFIAPNDLVVDKKDGIYFTDPYTIRGPEAKTPDLPQAVYYIPPGGGKTIRAAVGISRPNGISLSQDGSILFVNDWGGEYLIAYDVQPDGTLTNRRNFGKYADVRHTDKGYWGTVSGADGLAIDNDNRTYAYLSKDFTTPIGIQVFSPAGELLGVIPIPIQGMGGNLGFGGPDKKDLYVVGHGAVLKIHMLSQGPKNRAK